MRVVILEDCDGPRETYKGLLRNVFKCVLTVLEFTNGDEAWIALTQEEPHLLITDCTHPGMTCEEMLRRLNQRNARFPIFIISSSAHGLERLLPELPKLRVQFFAKPFDVPKLATAFAESVPMFPGFGC